MRKRLLPIVFFAASSSVLAQEPDYLQNLKHYQPEHSVSGTIRNWGNNYIPALMQRWEDGFLKYQPSVNFKTDLKGTEASMAGLYAGIADLAFIGREAYEPELNGFKERFGYEPLGIEISSGSFNTPHKTFALMVFVHKDNPLKGLTMAQLEAIFGCGKSVPHPVRTWGDVGLTGAWRRKPIHVYGYKFDTGMAAYFNRAVLHNSGEWNDSLNDFDNGKDSNGEVINAGIYILQALANDPDGIGFANVAHQKNDSVRAVSLARNAGGPFISPTKYTAWTREYPITRFTTVYVNRPPSKALDPTVREFIRYILSREGMQSVIEDGAYLPLKETLIEEQLKKLD